MREGFRTDLTYFAVSHLGVQLTVLAAIWPATRWLQPFVHDGLQITVRGQPLILQFVEALVVADLFNYATHRAMHQIPLLWRFHRVHHSATHMDWLAGSRLHLVDMVVSRAITYAPLFLLGFDERATLAYLAFVAAHAVFNHANVRFDLRALEWLFVTPRYHHWHHADDVEAYDRNFAVHLPLIDRLFGTHHLPTERWPADYGMDGRPMPQGFVAQLIEPLFGGSGHGFEQGDRTHLG